MPKALATLVKEALQRTGSSCYGFEFPLGSFRRLQDATSAKFLYVLLQLVCAVGVWLPAFLGQRTDLCHRHVLVCDRYFSPARTASRIS